MIEPVDDILPGQRAVATTRAACYTLGMTALERAIMICGGPKHLGARLGISRQAVSKWRRAPAERVLEIERITGISRYEMRPDIYGDPPGPLRRPAPAAAVAA